MLMKKMMIDSRELVADRKGATAIEYGLIAAGIALVVVAAIALLSPQLTATFGALTTALTPPA
ncbi:Flp family type IVb pilin [uncultured Roseobacter sp.]|uniref:Flp family type IVb pilin n=1 Tax=uncultured Roseobacter sp. TaxID=114847 RepID=UPI00261ACC4F|nr:Flp family type IVb pilin [uncultured Roseobacter sp.]